MKYVAVAWLKYPSRWEGRLEFWAAEETEQGRLHGMLEGYGETPILLLQELLAYAKEKQIGPEAEWEEPRLCIEVEQDREALPQGWEQQLEEAAAATGFFLDLSLLPIGTQAPTPFLSSEALDAGMKIKDFSPRPVE